jgi:hypothetical protein
MVGGTSDRDGYIAHFVECGIFRGFLYSKYRRR